MARYIKRNMAVLFATLIMGVATFAIVNVQAVYAADGDIDGGVYDGVPWRITSDYELIIGEEGKEYTFDYREKRYHYDYSWSNKSFNTVKIEGTVCGNGSMSGMFYVCHFLTSLDLSGFDTSNVTDMSKMFEGCLSLTSIDLSGFNTSNVTDMSKMFDDCISLTNLDVSGFDTSNVVDMFCMFADCSSLTSLDLSGLDTSNVLDMAVMFRDCSSLTSLDLSGLDTSKVRDMSDMFSNCSSLQTLTVGDWTNLSVNHLATFPFAMKDTTTGTVYDAGDVIPFVNRHTFIAVGGGEDPSTGGEDPSAGNNRFMRGRDNNSYIHDYSDKQHSGFYGVKTYSMGAAYAEALALESDLGGKAHGIIASMTTTGGWCYGIAATIALVHEGYLSVEDISSDTASTYYEMSPPCRNEKLKNTINYYFIAQENISNQAGYYTTIPAGMIQGSQLNLSNASTEYREFLKKLVRAAQEEDLIFATPGHAVLITGCTKNDDDTYTLQVYDENSVQDDNPDGEFGTIDVDIDRYRLEYTDYAGNVVLSAENAENEQIYFSTTGALASASEIGILTAKNRSILTIPKHKPVTIKDKIGRVIVEVHDNMINFFDMPVYKMTLYLFDVAGEEHDQGDEYIQVEVDKLEDIVVESGSDDVIEIGLRDSDNAAQIKGSFDKATIDMGEEISVDGEFTDYYVGLSSNATTETGDKGVLVMSGSSIEDLEIAADTSSPTFEINSINGSDNTTVTYYDGNDFNEVQYSDNDEPVTPPDPAVVPATPTEPAVTPTEPATTVAPTAPAEKVDLPSVKITKPKAGKKSATIKWKKVSKKNQKKIAKIEIQYSLDKKFKKGVKTVYAKKSAVSKKISKLKSKKQYYVRIRAYKKSGGTVHVSKWSAKKTVKTR